MYKKDKIFECIRFFLKMNIPVKAPAITYQTHMQRELRLSQKTYRSFLRELEFHFKINIPDPVKNSCTTVEQLTVVIGARVNKTK